MRNIVLLCLLFLSFISTAQYKAGVIEYNVRGLEVGVNEKYKNYTKEEKEFAKLTNEGFERLVLKLNFNDEYAHFYLEKVLDVGAYNYAIGLSKSLASKGEFFYNFQRETVIRQIDKFGKLINIVIPFSEVKWKLHNETKNIQGDLCYKATTIKVVNNSKGRFEHEIVAWYNPKLPIPLGPKQYVNLPGLIMELYEPPFGITYYIKNIEFKNFMDVEKPNPKAEVYSVEEYQKLLEKGYENFKSMSNN